MAELPEAELRISATVRQETPAFAQVQRLVRVQWADSSDFPACISSFKSNFGANVEVVVIIIQSGAGLNGTPGYATSPQYYAESSAIFGHPKNEKPLVVR
jgi:hypothetical protein